MRIFSMLVNVYDVLFRVFMRLVGTFYPITEATTVFGAHFKCSRRDFIQRRIAFFGLYEPNLTFFLMSILKPGDIFVDVGANIGYFSLLAAKCVGPEGKVCSIEASPSTYELLLQNLRRNNASNVDAVNMAAVDKDCYVTICRGDPRNIGTNSVRINDDSTTTEVVGRPVSAIIGSYMDKVRVIKVDVEGGEGLILPEIFEYYSRNISNVVIISEISKGNEHLIECARAKGFSVRAISNNYKISHLLVRSFLRLTGEGDFFVINDTEGYVSDLHDYVFARDFRYPHEST